jgi:hypothetical protein
MTNEILTNYVKNYKTRFIAKELIDDLMNLCVKTGGRIEARQGTHDDVVMSYLIGCYVYEYGKNIHQWGIVKGMRPMSKEKNISDQYTYADYYEQLPEELKSFFPKPGGEHIDIGNRMINSGSLIPESSLHDENVPENGFYKSGNTTDNEIYRQIQSIHQNKEVIQPDGTKVKIKSNLAPSEMIKQATENPDDISDDTFDICNLLND